MADRAPAPRLRVSIAAALVGGVTVLILVAVGAVLAVSLGSARENTLGLLGDKSALGMDLLETRLRSRLDPLAGAAQGIARLIDAGTLAPDDQDAMVRTLEGALAALPQAIGFAYVGTDLQALRIARPGAGIALLPDAAVPADVIRPQLAAASAAAGPVWTEPIWIPPLGQAVLSVRVPVYRDGRFIGLIAAGVSLGDLGAYLRARRQSDGVTGFVLVGNGRVLAHPDLVVPAGDDLRPVSLPEIATIADAALAPLSLGAAPQADAHGIITYAGAEHVVRLRTLAGYADTGWHIGMSVAREGLGSELTRLRTAAAIGVAILIAAIVLGQILGRRLTEQIRRIGTAAEHLSDLDLDGVTPLPPSRFRELDHAARAVNAMVAAMRWFEAYVPKTLVLRLMRLGVRNLGSVEREVTVMFTDIRGFSRLAEHLSAAEVAALLNGHFELVARCIENEGGTVDKFIGDSVMAFWGAPERVADHAVRALRAARAIRSVVEARPDDPAIRVGIHTGSAVVGNIGTTSRINYTVVGDTVNVAARLEALAKEVAPDARCAILVSRASARAAGEDERLVLLGPHALRGRDEEIEVFYMN